MNRRINPRWVLFPLLAACAGGLALLAERGAPGSLLPHGYCFTWNPALLWTHVASDTLIGLAYVSIPLTLLHLVRKRTDMPFNWIVLLFATFIVSCGATHWIEVWTVWNPDYWLAGSVKLLTAGASVATAGALIFLVPRILAIPTTGELSAAKAALEEEVRRRQRVEDELRLERAELERRVFVRTEELGRATAVAEAAHSAAEEANRLKDRFLAKVSHELRTPLQSTLSWAQVLRQSEADPTRTALAAQRIVHNVRSQARLIDDLLDISRILSGKLRLELQDADLGAVIERAVEVVRSGARPRGVAIELTMEGAHVHTATDPARLEQVVWNLVSNAVQATPEGGRVCVAARLDADALHLAVQDWGHGIDPADLVHIFEPFRQGMHGASSHRGLGLGLAITRSIVELFGGELQAQSDGPDRGACFTVRLPLRALVPAPGDGDAGLSAGETGRLHGLRVLYVEDDPDIAEAGRLLLDDLGVRVQLCLTFAQAQRRLREGGFDVLLSDLTLDGGHSALQLMPALRDAPEGGRVVAVAMSAHGSDADRAASRAAGFALHLVKPVDAVALARALLHVIG